jgi:hypothetical protein
MDVCLTVMTVIGDFLVVVTCHRLMQPYLLYGRFVSVCPRTVLYSAGIRYRTRSTLYCPAGYVRAGNRGVGTVRTVTAPRNTEFRRRNHGVPVRFAEDHTCDTLFSFSLLACRLYCDIVHLDCENMSNNHIPDADELAANKRAALAGQWRTPPMPVYPTGYRAPTSIVASPAPAPATVPEPELPNPTTIPTNSDEYAKALQEAYRKGAEAAARMAQQQIPQQQIPQQQIPQQQIPQQHLQTAASCPEFSVQDERPSPFPVHPTAIPIPDHLASSSMPPPPPQHPHGYSNATQLHTLSTVTPPPPPTHYSAPLPATAHQPPPPHYATVTAPPQAGTPASTVPQNPSQARSMSMPDMASYAVQAEEEKRQKRLARNRQSARLRRQRKKNLVSIPIR